MFSNSLAVFVSNGSSLQFMLASESFNMVKLWLIGILISWALGILMSSRMLFMISKLWVWGISIASRMLFGCFFQNHLEKFL